MIECDGQGNLMAMDAFAIMAGIFGLFNGVVSFCSFFMDCVDIMMDGGTVIVACRLLETIALLIVASIGLENYGSVQDECKSSPLGVVVFAWCTIRLIGAIVGCPIQCLAGWFSAERSVLASQGMVYK